MSFHLFMNDPFENEHENKQFCLLLDRLRSYYEVSDRSFCYCLANVNFQNLKKTIRGQYDIILLTPQDIIVVELKDMRGILRGDLTQDDSSLLIEHLDGSSSELSLDQVPKQHNYLQAYFAFEFSRKRSKPEDERHRVDVYWVFPSETAIEATITHFLVKRWLRISTVDDLVNQIKIRGKYNGFTLTPEDAEYVARSKFHLQEIHPENFLLVRDSTQDYLVRTLDFLLDRASPIQSLYLIKQRLLNYLAQSELKELLYLHRSISEWYLGASPKEFASRYRELISKIEIQQPPVNLLESHYARKVLEKIHQFSSQVVQAFTQISEQGQRSQELLLDLHNTSNEIINILGVYDLSNDSLLSLDEYGLDESNRQAAYILALLSAMR